MSADALIGYDPSTLEHGVVHIGAGGFMRGHFADFLHDLAKLGTTAWGMVGIKPHSEHLPEFDDPKKWLYTLAKGEGGDQQRDVIGVVRGIIGGKGRGDVVVDKLASPVTKVISLTITSNGYCLDDSRALDMQRLGPEIVAIQKGELKNLETAPGLIVASLYERFQRGDDRETLPTILSLDNIERNGDSIKQVVQTLANAVSRSFGEYSASITCPNTSVDRIVPACPKDSPMRALPDVEGYSILTEKWRSLAIQATEDTRLPPLHKVGAHLVDDIGQAEDLKLRLVNGPHLALAVVAKVLGIERVHEAVDADKNPSLRRFIGQFIDEAGSAITPAPQIDLARFRDNILERFESNKTDVVPRLLQSTSGKVVPRLFNSYGVKQDMPTNASAFAIGAWLNYMQKKDEAGNSYELQVKDVNATVPETARDLEIHLGRGPSVVPDDDLRAFSKRALAYYQEIKADGLRAALERNYPPERAVKPEKKSGPALNGLALAS